MSRLQLAFMFVVGCYMASTGVNAQNSTVASISTGFFYGAGAGTCTGQNFTSPLPVGACTANGGSYTSYYCSNNGQYVYVYTFSSAGCAPSSVVSIAQLPTSCGFTTYGLQYTCVNPSSGPAPPLSFPPAGWIQSSYCLNATGTSTYPAASVCSSSDPKIHCMLSASLQGTCKPTGSAALPYSITGCTADGSNLAVAYYSDSSCTTLAQISTQPVGCYGGVSATCGAYTFPQSIFPNKGYTQYDNSACGPSTSTPPVTTLFTDGCSNSQSYSCASVAGVTTGTFLTYNDPSAKGQCPATGLSQTISQTSGVCQNKRVFICPASSGSASSSSGAATSASSSTAASSVSSSTASSVTSSSTAASSTTSSSSTGASSASGSTTAATSSTGAAGPTGSTTGSMTGGSSGSSSGNYTSSTGPQLPLNSASVTGINYAFSTIVAGVAVIGALIF